VAFEMRLNLFSSADWIAVPKHLILMNGGRTFSVRVDPRKLSAGVYFAEIFAVGTQNIQ
jgi:hypothetical protein